MAKKFGFLVVFVYFLFLILVGLMFTRNFVSTRDAYIKIAENYISGIKQTFSVFSRHRDMKFSDIAGVIDELTGSGDFDYLAYVVDDSIAYWQSKYDFFLPIEPESRETLRIVRTIDHDILEFRVNIGRGTYLIGGYSLEFLDRTLKKQRRTGITLVLFSTLIFMIALFGIFKFHQNIIRMEARIKEEEAEKKRFQELSAFSSLIAHEIKNPLNTINMAIQMIEQKCGSDKFTNVIKEETKRLMTIVNEFRNIARPVKIKALRCSLKGVIDKVKRSIEAEFGSVFDLEIEENARVFCDPHWMEQVFYNLIKNSIEAGANRISIKIYDRGIEIEDNGPGLEDNTDKIFEMFYTTKTRGLGIGLYLVKKIVEAHGWSIEVKSDRGKGTKFIIRFGNLR